MADDQSGKRSPAPPYVSYQTFKTLIGALKEHVIPNRIDRSTLGRFSGAVQNQLMAALKFLALMDQDGRPTNQLKALVSSFGTDDWSGQLAILVKSAYAPVFKLQLATTSPSEFNEVFQQSFSCEGDTLRKAASFFLNAGKEAGIPFSPYLTKAMKTRSASPKRRPRNGGLRGTAGEQPDGNGGAGDPPPPPPPPPPSSMAKALLEKFPAFDPSWTDDLKAKWFEGYQKLLTMGDKA